MKQKSNKFQFPILQHSQFKFDGQRGVVKKLKKGKMMENRKLIKNLFEFLMNFKSFSILFS